MAPSKYAAIPMSSAHHRVELVFFAGCPNVEKARAAVREVLAAEGEVRWKEWNLDTDDVPARLRRHPSPTVLVDGLPVGDTTPLPAGVRACRSVAPSAQEIRAALEA